VHCFVFDIETVPDVDYGRRLYGLDGLSDEEVARIMFTQRRAETGGEFLPLEQHRVVVISIAYRTRDSLKVWSLGEPGTSEREIITRFFDGLEKHTPDLITWNGSGFDLPVLHYRSLLHAVPAARYWETGDDDTAFRYNNYLNRFHWRHVDLMDVLSGFQGRGRASLDDIATLLGLPGKLGMRGADVWDAYRAGRIIEIRNYCETDVLNTYLIYLRFQLIRGRLSAAEHKAETTRVRSLLAESDKPHFAEFLAAWPQTPMPESQ
jgi:predicted PolB exonuclease-like 3'-5' exonuclease